MPKNTATYTLYPSSASISNSPVDLAPLALAATEESFGKISRVNV